MSNMSAFYLFWIQMRFDWWNKIYSKIATIAFEIRIVIATCSITDGNLYFEVIVMTITNFGILLGVDFIFTP